MIQKIAPAISDDSNDTGSTEICRSRQLVSIYKYDSIEWYSLWSLDFFYK